MKIKIVLSLMALVSFSKIAFASEVNANSITQGVVYIQDRKTAGVDGGSCGTAGTWLQRDLNTLEGDTDLVSLSSNDFTLQPGTYTIDASAPARGLDAHKIRIYDITNSTAVLFGTSVTANSFTTEDSVALLNGFLTITSPTTYRLEHACQTTKAINGFGSLSNMGAFELYSVVKITRLR